MNIENIDEVASFCKRTGIMFRNSDIYGGHSGFWDYGPIGIEIKRNIKNLWWKEFVEKRDDVIGVDGAIISRPEVWKASGHVDSFNDPLLDCKECNERIRADHLIEDELGIAADGIPTEKIDNLIDEHGIECPKCGGELTPARTFNLMFETFTGPVRTDDSKTYLRPETAQLIFTNFKLAKETSRKKLPFGIAQMGKAFRNEISPRNYIFRSREFEQMEIEYFAHPDKIDECHLMTDEIRNYKVNVTTREMQDNGEEIKEMKLVELLEEGLLETEWHLYWLYQQYKWMLDLGLSPENLRMREHFENELAHYAKCCFDIEYKFPFGWKEIYGNADRTNYDLKKHIEYSDENLDVYDQEKGERVIPYVVSEPSQGVERLFLAFIVDAMEEEEDRFYLDLDPRLAPVKCRIFPLMTKDGLDEKAAEVHEKLKDELNVEYEERGSMGKRYARADEVGVPYCVTIDYDTLEDDTVTIRDRNSTDQIRVKIDNLAEILSRLVEKEVKFEEVV